MAENDFEKTMKLPAGGKATAPEQTGKFDGDADKTTKLTAAPAQDQDKTMVLTPGGSATSAVPPQVLRPMPPPPPPPPPAPKIKMSIGKIAAFAVPAFFLLSVGTAWLVIPRILRKSAEKLALQNQHAQSARTLMKAVMLMPAPLDKYLVPLGRELRLSQDYSEAEKYLLRVLKKNSASYDALFELAQTYQQAGQKQKAFDTFQKCLAIQPNEPHLLKWSAMLAYELKDFNASVAAYEKLTKSGAADADDWAQLGTAYLEMGKLAESEAAMTAALEKNPQLKGANALLAKNFSLRGKWPEAASRYKAEMVLTPGDPALIETFADAAAKACEALLSQNKTPEAIAVVQDGLAAGSKQAPALNYQLAACWAQEKKPKDALKTLREALSADNTLKSKAAKDSAFASLRKFPDFRKMTKQ